MHIPTRFLNSWGLHDSLAMQQRINDDDEFTHLLSKNNKYNNKTLSSGGGGTPPTPARDDSAVDLSELTKQSNPHFEDIKQEAVAIINYTWPLLITFVVGKGMGLVDVWFLGRLGSEGRDR